MSQGLHRVHYVDNFSRPVGIGRGGQEPPSPRGGLLRTPYLLLPPSYTMVDRQDCQAHCPTPNKDQHMLIPRSGPSGRAPGSVGGYSPLPCTWAMVCCKVPDVECHGMTVKWLRVDQCQSAPRGSSVKLGGPHCMSVSLQLWKHACIRWRMMVTRRQSGVSRPIRCSADNFRGSNCNGLGQPLLFS